MPYIREDIRGTSGQDINKINENFMNIFEKVFGDINFSDVDTALKNKINTQWIPVQGEGNLDKNYPLYLRFFIPPNTSKVKSTDFNIMCENYRMDSSITSTQPSNVYTDSQTSSEYPGTIQSSSSTTQGYSSVSNANVGVSSVGGGGSTSASGGGVTSDSGGGATAYVTKWGMPGNEVFAPTDFIYPNNTSLVTSTASGSLGYVTTSDSRLTYGALIPDGKLSTSSAYFKYLDLYSVQHSHSIKSHTHYVRSHTHSLPEHSHSITLEPHTHSITMQSHSHDVTIPSHSHTVSMKIEIPEHSHELKEGVMVSTTQPNNVIMYINDEAITTIDSSNPTSNNLDITDKIKIGEWNIIKVTTNNLARVSIYGTLEIVVKNM